MEDQKKPTNPPTGRFMDISAPAGGSSEPKAVPVVTETVQDAPSPPIENPVETPVESVPVAATVAEPPIAEAPAETAAEPPAEAVPSDSPEEPQADAQVANEQPATLTDNHTEQQPQSPPKPAHKAPVIAVFVAMAVCLVLTGLVVLAYVKSKNDTKTSTTSSSNGTTPVEKPQASPDDIDQTNNAIDESLSSVNDDSDFAASALSDQALGL